MSRYSPLRYPGGKGKLAPYLSEVISLNALEDCHYIEPFAGGAAVALELLFKEQVRHIHINDVDPCIYAFWHSVVFETDDFIERIKNVDVTIESWLAAREIKRNPSVHSVLDLGFATFFLSRTNRSGILNGGVIGGLDQSGAWKIDCRFNKDDLISRVRRIGFFRSRISIYSQNGADFVRAMDEDIGNHAFLYVDPPYYVKGAYLYENHFDHSDHVSLSEEILRISGGRWIISYDNVTPVSEIYSGFEKEIFSVDYTARSYATGSEIMIFAPGLIRPKAIYCSEKQRRMQLTA
ncbi:MAG: DNA adenine methylase [Flavobacteriaceae bacterium]|nr:DNA adenine methylase [Flavobacteriaceae bacterium]